MTIEDSEMKVHPAVAGLIPPLTDEQFQALERDMKAHGQLEPIVVKGEYIIDGATRYAICLKLELAPKIEEYTGPADNDSIRAYAISVNVHRRHLIRAQRRVAIKNALKAMPDKSNRAIAQETGTDHKTVGVHRKELVSTGEIPSWEKTTGADGRRRPAKKAKAPSNGPVRAMNEYDDDDEDTCDECDSAGKKFREFLVWFREFDVHFTPTHKTPTHKPQQADWWLSYINDMKYVASKLAMRIRRHIRKGNETGSTSQ
jgi:hypothetical protein